MREKDEDGYALRPNRTAAKRDINSLRTVAEMLVDLPVGKFEKLKLDPDLTTAINASRQMQKSALQRQIRFIIGIMKNYEQDDILKIQQQYEIMMLPIKKENTALHRLEDWRDKLIKGDNELLEKLVSQYGADRQYLRQLVRNINKELKKQEADDKGSDDADKGDKKRMPKTARVLFKHLQELIVEKGEVI